MGIAVLSRFRGGTGRKTGGRIAALRSSVGISDNVRRVWRGKIRCARLAGFALQDACMATNPKMMERSDVEAIYEAII
jgi:alcohol dehydrogenase class IV